MQVGQALVVFHLGRALDFAPFKHFAELSERHRVGLADEGLNRGIEILPGLELSGPLQQIVQHQGGSQFTRGGIPRIPGHAHIGSPQPHHRLEIATKNL